MDKFHFTLRKRYKAIFDDNDYRIIRLPDSEQYEEVRLVAALRESSNEFDLDKIVRVEPCWVLKETTEEMRPLWKLRGNL